MQNSLTVRRTNLPRRIWGALLVSLWVCAAYGADDTLDLRKEIARADAKLFDAVFGHCDADVIATLVTDDFEFYHDKWGQIANSKQQFVDNIRGNCARQASGSDPKARRELVGAIVVYPMKGYGAIEIGTHRFFQTQADGTEVMTERAKFTQLWRQVDGRWLLARVLSYDHRDYPRAADRAARK